MEQGLFKKKNNKWFHTSKCPRLFRTYLYSYELINNKTWNDNTRHYHVSGRQVCQKWTKSAHQQPQTRPPQYQCTHQVLWKFIEFYLSYHPEMKIRTYCLHINLSKNNEICLLKFPNQIFTISMFRPNLVKIHWHLLKLSSGNKNTDISSKHNVY